jgi:hypothetical protein
LAAEALVLGLQVAEASLKDLAAGTRDELHTSLQATHGQQLRDHGCGVMISVSWTR